MANGLILTNAGNKATFDGTKFDVSYGSISGAYTTIKSAIGTAYNKATGTTDSTSDGQVAWFRVHYIDQSYLTHHAVFLGTYEDSDDTITPVSGSIVESSSGSAMPSFDQESEPNLYVVSVAPNEALGVRTLQEVDTEVITSGLASTTSTTYVDASDSKKVTPESSLSYLKGTVSVHGYVRRESSGTGVLSYLALSYVNDSGTTVQLISDLPIGDYNFPADADQAAGINVSIPFTLSQSHLNNDGTPAWEFLAQVKTAATDRRVVVQAVVVDAREFIR